MVDLAKAYLAAGIEVRIVTARVGRCGKRNVHGVKDGLVFATAQAALIRAWCKERLGAVVPITAKKDMNMILLYDDRAVQVERDTGRILGGP